MSENTEGATSTHLALIEGEQAAAGLAVKLIAAAAWFVVTPMPDGIYAVEVKREAAVIALVQRHLAEVESERSAKA